jgi:C_GCAxxG_C_C family probable redox protein
VLTVFASEFGLSDEMALKIAASFGGGMARTGKTCGAVTGGLMALGLKYGYTAPEGRDATYGIAQEFMRRFEEKHSSLVCRDLIGFDISTPENRERAQQSGMFQNICPGLVRDAAEIVQELLAKKP